MYNIRELKGPNTNFKPQAAQWPNLIVHHPVMTAAAVAFLKPWAVQYHMPVSGTHPGVKPHACLR